MINVPHSFAVDSVCDNVALLVVDGSQSLARKYYILRAAIRFSRFQRPQQITEGRVNQH